MGERKQIIEWMRDQAIRCGAAANAAVDPSVKMSEIKNARWYILTAACIERGAHVPAEIEDDTYPSDGSQFGLGA